MREALNATIAFRRSASGTLHISGGVPSSTIHEEMFMKAHCDSTGTWLASGCRTLIRRSPKRRNTIAAFPRTVPVHIVITGRIRVDSRNRRKPTARALSDAVTPNGGAWGSRPSSPLGQPLDLLLIPGFGPAPRWCDHIAEVIVAIAVVALFIAWWVLP